MRNLDKYLLDKKIVFDKLLEYGFNYDQNLYRYETLICDSKFKIIIEISNEQKTSKVVDNETKEEYILVDIVNAKGDFVGSVKEEYEKILKDIISRCTKPNVFKSKQTVVITNYIKEKYDDELEYLWEKFPKDAIWRNKSNNKWYGLIMSIKEDKLGIQSDRVVEVLDLRYQKDKIDEIVDEKCIFKGYHMNKNNWITIILDSGVDTQTILKLVDNSYNLSLHK